MPNKSKGQIQGDLGKFIAGNWNAICDTCGFKRKASEMTLSYGSGDIPVLFTCRDNCSDQRHPLNSPPPIIFDGQPVPDARPDATQDSTSSQWFIVNTTPSLMTWGAFPNTGGWGTLNFSNSEFNLDPVWTWGSFARP